MRHCQPLPGQPHVHLRIAPFIGHRIEGKKPSFFEDLQYLWVGPTFVVSKLFLQLGIRW